MESCDGLLRGILTGYGYSGPVLKIAKNAIQVGIPHETSKILVV